MACSACGGKSRRPLRNISTGTPIAQQPVNTGKRSDVGKSVIDNMRIGNPRWSGQK